MSGNSRLARDLSMLPRGSLAVRVAEALAEKRQGREQGEPDERREQGEPDERREEAPERRLLSQIRRSGQAVIRQVAEEGAATSPAAIAADEAVAAPTRTDDAADTASPGTVEAPAGPDADADDEQATRWVVAEMRDGWIGEEADPPAGGSAPGEEAPAEPRGDSPSIPVSTGTAAPADALEQARAETAQWRARAEQAQAELAAVRRRGERNLIELSEVAVGEVMTGIIPIVDDLERAIAHLPAVLQGDPWVAGVLMIGDRLRAALETHGVERIVPHGEAFDPHRHEAVARVHLDDIPEDTITNVLLAGYILNGRVLRPAHVQVAVRKEH